MDEIDDEQIPSVIARMMAEKRKALIAEHGDDPANWPLPFPMFALNEDRDVVECKTMGEFMAQFSGDPMEFERRRIVAQTQVTPDVRVSTVFVGIDIYYGLFGRLRPEPLKPRVFETMIFGGPLDGDQRKHTSYAEAVRGHADAVLEVESALLQEIADKRTALH